MDPELANALRTAAYNMTERGTHIEALSFMAQVREATAPLAKHIRKNTPTKRNKATSHLAQRPSKRPRVDAEPTPESEDENDSTPEAPTEVETPPARTRDPAPSFCSGCEYWTVASCVASMNALNHPFRDNDDLRMRSTRIAKAVLGLFANAEQAVRALAMETAGAEAAVTLDAMTDLRQTDIGFDDREKSRKAAPIPMPHQLAKARQQMRYVTLLEASQNPATRNMYQVHTRLANILLVNAWDSLCVALNDDATKDPLADYLMERGFYTVARGSTLRAAALRVLTAGGPTDALTSRISRWAPAAYLYDALGPAVLPCVTSAACIELRRAYANTGLDELQVDLAHFSAHCTSFVEKMRTISHAIVEPILNNTLLPPTVFSEAIMGNKDTSRMNLDDMVMPLDDIPSP